MTGSAAMMADSTKGSVSLTIVPTVLSTALAVVSTVGNGVDGGNVMSSWAQIAREFSHSDENAPHNGPRYKITPADGEP